VHENANPIVKRIAVKASCAFDSPALIGSGADEHTDSDVLRRKNGEAFLPGSTIAGVLSSLLSTEEARLLFGQQDDEHNISPLWVFDTELKDEEGKRAKVIELDGVAIDSENKVAVDKRKYDFEAVQRGTKFTLRFLLVIRKDDDKLRLENLLWRLVGALKSGAVAFGAKVRRGFGAVTCSSSVKREFSLTKGNLAALAEWIAFEWDIEGESPEAWADADCRAFSGDTAEILAALSLDGSIMIRDIRNIYNDLSDNEEVPDYMHISCGKEPVVFGTSWAGAFRSGLYRLLKQKHPEDAAKYIDDVFGYLIEPKDGGEAKTEPSKVTFAMSFLENVDSRVDGYRQITRVKIDRFTGGAADGALFSEKPQFGGKTELRIGFPKEREDIRELIMLGLEALDKGLIQVGGEASIGRGFFSVTGVAVDGVRSSLGSHKEKAKLKACIDNIGKAGGSM